MALSPASTVLFEPSMSLPTNSIVSVVVGSEPTSTCTFNPLAPVTRFNASSNVDCLISRLEVLRVITPEPSTENDGV